MIAWKRRDCYWELNFKGTSITIEARPHYCDRGNWIAKMFNPGSLWIDSADGWPRYYFSLEIAKLECESFVRKREMLGQFDGQVREMSQSQKEG